MKHRKRVTRSAKRSVKRRSTRSSTGARRKTGKAEKLQGLTLHAAVESPRRRLASRHQASMKEVLEFYRPIKKPVTLRLDADVIAWFKREGRRYQTRINAALRRVMEREMRNAG